MAAKAERLQAGHARLGRPRPKVRALSVVGNVALPTGRVAAGAQVVSCAEDIAYPGVPYTRSKHHYQSGGKAGHESHFPDHDAPLLLTVKAKYCSPRHNENTAYLLDKL
jgi:hypothetical protein